MMRIGNARHGSLVLLSAGIQVSMTLASPMNAARVPPPVITSVMPASGAPGESITINGSNLYGATSVKFNGVNALHFTVDDGPLRITAIAPSVETSGPIVVTTPGGTATSVAAFVVKFATPVRSAMKPGFGKAGTVVDVRGTGFTGATKVEFTAATGTVSAAFEVISFGRLFATVPQAAVTGQIRVTNPAGTGSDPAVFTVLFPPTITGFSPDAGGAGTQVTITGTHFKGSNPLSKVLFMRVGPRVPAAFTVVSDSEVRATVPLEAISGPIAVINVADTVQSTASFTVTHPPPAIASFSPVSGAPEQSIAIAGASFLGATAVRFNGVNAPGFSVNATGTQIAVSVPGSATSGPITVTTSVSTTTSPSPFTVLAPAPPAPPTISGFTPPTVNVGSNVTISGANLKNATAVKLNGVNATILSNTPTQVVVNVPPPAFSLGPISVTTALGTATSSTNLSVK